MSNWKITIEGSGPCLDNSEFAADKGGKMLVNALEANGQHVTRAEFAGNGKLPKDILLEARKELEANAKVIEERVVISEQPVESSERLVATGTNPGNTAPPADETEAPE